MRLSFLQTDEPNYFPELEILRLPYNSDLEIKDVLKFTGNKVHNPLKRLFGHEIGNRLITEADTDFI